MKKLFLTCTALIALNGTAGAEAILHVNDTSPLTDTTTVHSPVVVNSTQFYVQQTSNGQVTAPPLYIYFLDAPGGAAPTVTSAFLNGDTSTNFFGSITADGTYTLGNGQDSFYTSHIPGCAQGCGNSINDTNIKAAFLEYYGVAAPATFDVYKAVINGGFDGNEFYQINGLFGEGTIIAPYALTDAVTSWTNAGLVTNAASAPEPATWFMMILGFAGVGLAAMRKSRGSFRWA